MSYVRNRFRASSSSSSALAWLPRGVVAVAGALLAVAVGCSSELPAADSSSSTSLSEGHACSGSEPSRCNCPNDMFCCPTDGSCFKSFDDVNFTVCRDSRTNACAMPGAVKAPSGGNATTTAPGHGTCGGDQRAKCNCPADMFCCPTDGSCFKELSQINYTRCRDNQANACAMSGSTTTTPPPATPSPSPSPSNSGTLPTRLRVTNRCAQPIWMAHSDNVPDAQNVQLGKGQSRDYNIPDGGISATRFWPKLACDSGGHNCKIGDNGQGGGVPCPAGGCQPPIDSKFEASFGPKGGGEPTWYNLSQVDGYTIPFKVVPRGAGAEVNGCVTSDCGRLSLDQCPSGEDLSGGGRIPGFASEDLRVRDAQGAVIGCMAPCKKWNYPAPWGLGRSESDDPGLHMCCPTPLDPSRGQCTIANKCMSSESCRSKADPLSVEHTDYVAAMRNMCPSAYSYAYDDAAGLHTCPSTTGFEVIFCP